VRRGVGLEPPDRLGELTFHSDSPPAAGLVPRDRDVDEPLEEVALILRRGAPGVLELLVRREVLAAANEGKPSVEAVLDHRLNRHCAWRYAPAVATILLCGVDTFFRGKLEVLLRGHHLVTTDSADWPDLVIADISRVDPEEVADAYPDVPILGFGGHTDTSGLRRAHAAGFDQVVVKNALQERAAQLVEELTT
jgi:hypothetical protein